MTAVTQLALGAALGARGRAPCEDDPEKWFAEEGSPAVMEAKQGCLACPARLPCLRLAEATPEKFGVWGGLSASDRGWWRGSQAAAAPRRAASGRKRPPGMAG